MGGGNQSRLDPAWLVDGSSRARRTLLLAHGAGAPMDSPFMDQIAAGCAGTQLRVIRFEFPYMQERRKSGKRRPPNPARQLEAYWQEVIERVGRPEQLFIGGKSMGGRIASQVADSSRVAGLICLGYPFHPPGRPEKLRTAHLQALATPTLIVQGERDPFGTPKDVQGYTLSESIQIEWCADGDHSLKPRKASGYTEKQNLDRAIDAMRSFIEAR